MNRTMFRGVILGILIGWTTVAFGGCEFVGGLFEPVETTETRTINTPDGTRDVEVDVVKPSPAEQTFSIIGAIGAALGQPWVTALAGVGVAAVPATRRIRKQAKVIKEQAQEKETDKEQAEFVAGVLIDLIESIDKNVAPEALENVKQRPETEKVVSAAKKAPNAVELARVMYDEGRRNSTFSSSRFG